MTKVKHADLTILCKNQQQNATFVELVKMDGGGLHIADILGASRDYVHF
jgi:hypothetical protein